MGKIGKMVSRAWGVEESAVDSTPKLTYVIDGELCVENHGGVETVTENELKFAGGITVCGENLRLDWIEKDYAVITGAVTGVDFAKK